MTKAAAPAMSIFRCTACGHGTHLRAWTHVVAHGPVGVDGVIDHYDWTDDDDDLIEESINCAVHGESFVEKLIEGAYTAVMVNGRFVSARVALATALLTESDVKWDLQHRELRDLALMITGQTWRPPAPKDIARFENLAEARARALATGKQALANASSPE